MFMHSRYKAEFPKTCNAPKPFRIRGTQPFQNCNRNVTYEWVAKFSGSRFSKYFSIPILNYPYFINESPNITVMTKKVSL